MKGIKKALAVMLSVTMMLSLTPTGVMAEPVEPEAIVAAEEISVPDSTEIPVENESDAVISETDETIVDSEIQEDAVEEEPEMEEPEMEEPETAMKARAAGVDLQAVDFQSVITGTRPANGTTSGQPFPSGTAGSTNFRIPAMVTLNDGTIVTACDARWDTTEDGGGLDTLVSYSRDNGATWNYTMANYLGDNGNIHNTSSTAFIDPSLATDGSTVYMLVDLFPYGIALNGANQQPSTETGFDANGRLILTNGNTKYYLSNGKIYNANTNAEASGYTVDAYFNIKGTDGTDTNIFCSDSPYKVQRTGFLYLTKSYDGGATWSEPTLINAKNSGPKAYLVGPAGGIVTSTGRIIFPCYTFYSADGNTSVIYSDDGGATWTRSADMAEQTSEATICEVNGTLYMFTRHGGYYVSTDNGTTWSSQKSVGINYTTSCELDVMAYSQKIDGRDAIILSAGTNGRAVGKLFVGLFQDNGSIQWKYTYQVNSGTYQYSALSELSDGRVALLYEDGAASIKYASYDISTIAPNAEIGEPEVTPTPEPTPTPGQPDSGDSGSTTPEKKTVDVELYVNESKTFTDATGAYSVTTKPNTAIATVTATNKEVGGGDELTRVSSVTSGKQYVLSNTRSGNVLTSTKTGNFLSTTGTPSTNSERWTITQANGGYYVQNASGQYLTIGAGTAAVTSTPTVITLENGGSGWSVGQPGSDSWNEKTVNIALNGKYTQYTDGSYYVKDANGNYQIVTGVSYKTSRITWTISYSGGSVTQSGLQATLYTKSSGTQYLNDYSGNGTQAGGYDVKTDAGSYWNLDLVGSTDPTRSTEVVITGVAPGTTKAVVGNTTYNITVKELPPIVDPSTTPFVSATGNASGSKITKLNESVGLTYKLNVSGSNVSWSSADPSIATVDQNGNVKGIGVGETTVTAVVDGVPYTIPVVIVQNTTSTSTKLFDVYVNEITDTDVYYSWIYLANGANKTTSTRSDFIQAQEGEVIYVTYKNNDGVGLNFFGAPEDGYALTAMSAANGDGLTGKYDAIDTDTPSTTKFCTQNAGSNQRTAFGDSIVYNQVQEAIDRGCDGGMGWTRPSSNTSNVTGILGFRSRKLPTVEKSIKTVNGKAYTEGMIAHAGDVIEYNVTVTQYKTAEAITYTNAKLVDNLSGAKFTTTNSNTVTSVGLSNSTVSSDTVKTFTVRYTITDADLDKDIINTVDLTYTYQSTYSNGTFDRAAQAEAKISAATFAPNDIVVDFGLPVRLDFSGADAHGRYNLVSGTAKYGTVTVSNNVVTYKPSAIIENVDTVELKNTAGGTASFKVYPATSVYYEEGFADGFAANGNKGTVNQTKQIAGKTTDVYGYDAAYQSNSGASNGTQAQSTGKGSAASFTFTGTGVDIYANCSGSSGKAAVQIFKDGKIIKMIVVDTNTNSSIYSTISESAQYNLPIVAINGLAHGQYTVKVIQSGTDAISLDGYRVYGTLATEPAFYTADKEDAPVYFQLRDYVLTAIDDVANKNSAAVYAQVQEATQTALADGKTTGVAVVLSNSTLYSGKELLDNGPKNELYLLPGQKVVFNINTSRVVQIGLKAPNGSATVTGSVNATINTTTDMFYKVSGNTITLQNTSNSGILSVTKVKVCDDPAANLSAPTEKDLAVAMGEVSEPEISEPEVPEIPASKIATLKITYKVGKKVVGTATLTGVQSGKEKSYTFSPAEIKAAGPDGYTVISIAGTSVKYGSSKNLNATCM